MIGPADVQPPPRTRLQLIAWFRQECEEVLHTPSHATCHEHWPGFTRVRGPYEDDTELSVCDLQALPPTHRFQYAAELLSGYTDTADDEEPFRSWKEWG